MSPRSASVAHGPVRAPGPAVSETISLLQVILQKCGQAGATVVLLEPCDAGGITYLTLTGHSRACDWRFMARWGAPGLFSGPSFYPALRVEIPNGR